MNRGYWNPPVTIETLKLGRYQSVSSAAEAARILLDEWPVAEGKAFLAAQSACLMALEGTATPDEARAAFLAAADEANVFVRP